MIHIVTSCQHDMQLDRKVSEMTIGATFDCSVCGDLQVLSDDMDVLYITKNFNQWMHDKGPDPKTGFQWPADGANTGYVDVG